MNLNKKGNNTLIFSIIIPHHNIPKLLRRCLASIPSRDDVQVIVVDDCSGEEYKESLQKVECDYPGTEFVYLNRGGGGGKARNEGLKLAKGKYVLFADADDYFTYCFDAVLDEYKSKDYDVVYFNANSLDTDLYIHAKRCIHVNNLIKTAKKNPKKGIFLLRYRFGEPWCKMVKREIIENNNIRFSETIIHNDTKYSYLVGYYSQNVFVDERAIYCVTDRVGSVSKSISLDRMFVRTQVFAEATVFFFGHGISFYGPFVFIPLRDFLIKGDLKHAKTCVAIMRNSGMSNHLIYKGFVAFILKSTVTFPLKLLKNLVEKVSSLLYRMSLTLIFVKL